MGFIPDEDGCTDAGIYTPDSDGLEKNTGGDCDGLGSNC